MVRYNYLPMFAVGVQADMFFSMPLQTPELGVDAGLDSTKEELAYLVLTQFMEPFVDGDYGGIDPNNMYDELVIEISQYQEDDRMMVLMNSMSAAIGSRFLYSQLMTSRGERDACNTSKGELQNQLAQLEHELKVAKGEVEDMKQVTTKIEAKVTIQSVEVLPMIAKVNIVMGWYYYLNGYDPLKPIDPLKYLDAKLLVVQYGDRIDATTGRYGAYDELMHRLIQDKADRLAAAPP